MRRDSGRFYHETNDSHGFDELFDLLVQSSDIRIRIRRLFVHLHRLDSRVVF